MRNFMQCCHCSKNWLVLLKLCLNGSTSLLTILIFGTPYLSYSAKRETGKTPTAISLKRSFAYTVLASIMLNCFNKSQTRNLVDAF